MADRAINLRPKPDGYEFKKRVFQMICVDICSSLIYRAFQNQNNTSIGRIRPIKKVREFMLRYIAVFLSFIILSGCASENVKVDLSKLETTPSDVGKIFVIRPAYLAFAIRDLVVSANNSEVVALKSSSYTTFLSKPGQLTISGEGGLLSWPRKEISLTVESGNTYYLVWAASEPINTLILGPDKAGNATPVIAPMMEMGSIKWLLADRNTAQTLLNKTSFVSSHYKDEQ